MTKTKEHYIKYDFTRIGQTIVEKGTYNRITKEFVPIKRKIEKKDEIKFKRKL